MLETAAALTCTPQAPERASAAARATKFAVLRREAWPPQFAVTARRVDGKAEPRQLFTAGGRAAASGGGRLDEEGRRRAR